MDKDFGIYRNFPQWDECKERFTAWWRRSSLGRPLLAISAKRRQPLATQSPELLDCAGDCEYKHSDPEYGILRYRDYLNHNVLLAEAFPSTNVNYGPGSLALYLGGEPIFSESTIWYKEVVDDWQDWIPLKFDPANRWFKKHLDIIRRQQELADGEFLINIPDLCENVDILAAMRDPNKFCFDLIDEPDLIKEILDQLDELYFKYYDAFYDIVKGPDGSSSFTAFQIWGPGRTAKVQCDFCALMSPDQFYEFVQPSLRRQCQRLDNSLYHLDGPDAIKHLDALMEIEELDALQWTPGAGNPGGGDAGWYPIYDKVKGAGKSLWISITAENWQEAAAQGDALVERYGADGLYLLFHLLLTEDEAQRLLDHAESCWTQ